MVELSDQEFVDNLRAAVVRYLAGVDRWEAAYQRYYRMPGRAERVSADLEAEQREYETNRRTLEEMLPRARRLCLKHQLRDPFAGLLRISLGRHAPQHRVESAIGRNERNTATDCLVRMSEKCRVWAPKIPGSEAQAHTEPQPGQAIALEAVGQLLLLNCQRFTSEDHRKTFSKLRTPLFVQFNIEYAALMDF